MKITKILFITLFVCVLGSGSLFARSPWLGSDKPMHFIGSAYLVYWNYNLGNDVFYLSHQESVMFSISITSLLGTGKELSDKYGKKTRFSWYDMAYNAAGIAFGLIIIEAAK